MQPIPDYPGYFINQSGEIFSKKTNKWLKNYFRNKYLRICLTKHNKSKHFSVHRLVGEVFIPKIENKPFINHIDGNPQNNHVSNLEWCNRSENIRHAIKLGLLKHLSGKEHPNFGKKNPENALRQTGANNPNAKSVICLNNSQVFTTVKAAAEWCNGSSTSIIKVCRKTLNILGNPYLTAGKHPITREPLKWSYF